jgi:hypothetical protein
MVRQETWMIHLTPVRIGVWFGNLDLVVVPLDDHAMILGSRLFQSFLSSPLDF